MKGLDCSPFARHYLGNPFLFLFLRLLRCFSSPGMRHCFSRSRAFDLQSKRLPHSEIPGSKVACHFPEAYRRLLRPSSPFWCLGIHHVHLSSSPSYWRFIQFTPTPISATIFKFYYLGRRSRFTAHTSNNWKSYSRLVWGFIHLIAIFLCSYHFYLGYWVELSMSIFRMSFHVCYPEQSEEFFDSSLCSL